MRSMTRPWGKMHVQVSGPQGAPCVVFANSLGTDLRLWDQVVAQMPAHLRVLRFDKRGHGLSDTCATAFDISDLADDAIALIAAHASQAVVFVGLSIGGMIAQNIAARRPDLLAGVVLSNTAPKMGTQESWAARIAAVQTGGMDSIADAVMQRWFAPAFHAGSALALWRNMLTRTPAAGYIAACHALSRADLTAATQGLTLPCLVIAGQHDGSSTPDAVRTMAGQIAGAAFHEIAGVGHIPCVEDPASFTALLTPFLKACLNV